MLRGILHQYHHSYSHTVSIISSSVTAVKTSICIWGGLNRSKTIPKPRITLSASTTSIPPLFNLPSHPVAASASFFHPLSTSTTAIRMSSSASTAVAESEPPTTTTTTTTAEETTTTAAEEESEEPKPLPPLSGREFREFNRLAEHMDMFHSHFRSTWNILYESASSGKRVSGMSIRAFITTGLDFISHLETHHAIEERYVFPELAKKMPEFRTGKEKYFQTVTSSSSSSSTEGGGGGDTKKEKAVAAELLQQHVEIHKGMEGLQAYLTRCLSGEEELRMPTLKAQLDTWGAILWTHLDQEVKTLGAENMRRYWTVEEIRRLRM